MGYHRAGFDVVGIDIEKMFAKRYPFEFHQSDALEYVKEHGHEFDAIHASPPCQAYSITKNAHDHVHPELVIPTREALVNTGKPYIIENVPGAPMLNPLTLCGSEFGLVATDDDGRTVALRRHRLFESNMFLMGAGGCQHDPRLPVAGVYGNGCNTHERAKARAGGYTPPNMAVRRALMGIDWTTRDGLSQSIPPAYTEWIGRQILEQITWAAA